jgi:hypothetical protein
VSFVNILYKYVLYVDKFDQSQFAYKTTLNIARKKQTKGLFI